MSSNTDSPLVISYMLLRKLVGWLGILLPVILVLGNAIKNEGSVVHDSISYYYYTDMRDVFVGILCAVAIFMFAYKGYDKRDQIAGNLACFFALGIALFPTTEMGETDLSGTIHLISATLFFVVLIYFSLFLFPLHNPDKQIEIQKRRRNLIYKCCGVVMILCIVGIMIYMFFIVEEGVGDDKFNVVFWLEAIALWAFGVSWLTKGQFMLKDTQENEE